MSPHQSKPPKKPRGVIVWDFDGVLFDAKQFRIDNRSRWVAHGVPERIILEVIEGIRGRRKHFSVSEFLRGLRKKGYRFSKAFARSVFHGHLMNNTYYAPETDRLLDRLRQKGFIQMILSMGSAPFQYKKMRVGCGRTFSRHFVKIVVTKKPKYLTLAQLKRRFSGVPFLFIDDTKEHLLLAKRHVPGIQVIHYSNASKRTIRDLEQRILLYAKNA